MSVYCSVCGIREDVNQDITPSSKLTLDHKLLIHHAANQLKLKGWEYVDSCDEFICSSCENGPVSLEVSHKLIQYCTNYDSVSEKHLFRAVKNEVAEKLGVDAGVLNANMVEVKAYLNPARDSITFYLTPIGMKWSDIKKRYSREPENLEYLCE